MEYRLFATHGVEVLRSIKEAGTQPEPTDFSRRLFKLGEELGEATEVYLAITGRNNYKCLTVGDLREELADIFIVSADILNRFCAAIGPHAAASVEADMQRCFERQTPTDLSFSWLKRRLGSLYGKLGLAMPLADSIPSEQSARDTFLGHMTELYGLALDAMCVVLPGEESLDEADFQHRVLAEVERKVAKWKRVRIVTTIPA